MRTLNPQPPRNHRAPELNAAAHAELTLKVAHELFPDARFFDLSPDKRRMVYEEVKNLLLQSRWQIESVFFVNRFTLPAGPDLPPSPAYEHPPAVDDGKLPGQYA